jgi:uncharacterized protein (DUF2147 family)
MNLKRLFSIIILFLYPYVNLHAQSVPPSDLICGKWESSEKNLIVQVYKENGKFFGKIVWYTDTGGKPMDYGTDKRNPDPKLRSRKILGMSVLRDMVYDASSNSWEDGIIYESKHGKEWNASVYIDKAGMLKVKGYWHFKLIGKTMTFTRA